MGSHIFWSCNHHLIFTKLNVDCYYITQYFFTKFLSLSFLSIPNFLLSIAYSNSNISKPRCHYPILISSSTLSFSKVKENTDWSEVNSMTSRINGLTFLDQVFHTNVGPFLHIWSPSLTFNYIFHSHYNSKEDLNACAVHLNHVSKTNKSACTIKDIMIIP